MLSARLSRGRRRLPRHHIRGVSGEDDEPSRRRSVGAVDVRDGDLRATPREFQSHGPADALRCAVNQRAGVFEREGAKETARLIEAADGKAAAIACDVSSRESVREAAAETERVLGELDIVMNNVGVITNGNPEDIPIEEWRRIIDLNLYSVVYSNEVFIPKLLARGRGHIVNTASFAGLYPYAANRMPYVAAKAAVVALSESMALYLHPRGVRVSCLCPGPVATGVMNAMKSWSENIPFRGPGSQYKVASVEEAAVTLADGMRDGRVIIPTDEKVWDVIRRHAASPDAFIQEKIDEVARGEFGKPSL